MRGFRKREKAMEALSLYNKVVSRRPKLSLSSQFFSETMLACATGTPTEAQNAQKIWEDLLRAPGDSASLYTLSAFLCACATSGDWKRALRAFHRDYFIFATRAGQEKGRTYPDVVACTALMKALKAGRQWSKGEDLLQWMYDNGIEPNAYTYTTLISLLGECGQWEKALEYFNEVPEPNVHVFSATMNALTLAGRDDLALDLLDVMLARGIKPKAIVLVSLLSIYEKRHEGSKALSLFRHIQSKNPEAFEINILVYNVLLSALSKSEAVDCVKDVFEEISSHSNASIRPDKVTYETMISAYAHVADYQSADGVFRDMCEKGFAPSDYAYAARIKAYAKNNLWRESVAILREVEEQEGMEPSVHIYNATLYACEITQKWELALKLYARMEDKGIEPNRVTKALIAKICNEGIEIYEEKQRQTAAVAAIGAAAGALAIRTGLF